PGMEHWLALFHDKLETLFDYLPEPILSFDPIAAETIGDRSGQIREHYEACGNGLESTAFGAAPYKPLPPERTYPSSKEWKGILDKRFRLKLDAFGAPPTPGVRTRDFGARPGRSFAPERNAEGVNVFEAVAGHIKGLIAQGKRIV